MSTLKLVQVTCAIFWCMLAAGPIFGFAALKPILINEGVYSALCDKHSKGVCLEQDLKLNMMFAVGAVTTNACSLPVGYVLDHYGPRVSGFIGSIFIAVGSVVLALSKDITMFDPYLTGYVLLALGGPFVFISSFQLANSFPQNSGLILALVTGAFDSSSALFLFYRLGYEKSTIPLRTFFSWYLLVPAFIFICQLFIMPRESYKTTGALAKLEVEGLDENGMLLPGDDGRRIIPDINERTSLLSNDEVTPVYTANGRRKSMLETYVEAKLEKKTGVFGVLHGRTAGQQIWTPWFMLMQIFNVICMLRINYFVATIKSQETFLLGEAAAEQLNGIFDIALPVGGLIAIPFIGILIDSMKTITVLSILSVISVSIGILGLLPNYLANLVGILLLVAYRPFYYTVVSDFCSKVFGFETFGTVYGLMMCTSGILNMLQSPLDKATKTVFNYNPTPLNTMLVLATAGIAVALIGFVYRQTEVRKLTHLQEEANFAPEHAVPE